MSLATLWTRTEISSVFSDADEAIITDVINTAYNGSATARLMFEDWLKDSSHAIKIDFDKGKFHADSEIAGWIGIDLSYIKDFSYITDTGRAVLHSPLGAIVHELGHALHRTFDNTTNTDYMGDNVRYVNQIWAELGIPKEISYIAQAWPNLHKTGYQYTNGATIDAAHTGDETWNSSLLGVSRDLLIGGPSGNDLSAGAGNDFLVGAGGNDVLDGGDGIDTAVYFGNALDYDVRLNTDGTWTVRNVRGAKDEGTDTLKNMEKIQFAGKTFGLQNLGLTFQTDIAFVIDTTGSMGPYINNVKAQAKAVIDNAFSGDAADARFGVVGFKDTTNGEPSKVILPFTNQDDFASRKASAISAINSITIGGGGDDPETPFDGLRMALNGSIGQWRGGAGILRVVLFTDEAAKDGSLAAEVTALAHKIGAVVVAGSTLVGGHGTVDTFDLSYESADGSDLTSTGDHLSGASSELSAASLTTGGPSRVQIFTVFTGDSYVDTTPYKDIAAANGGTYFTADSTTIVDTLNKIIDLPPAMNKTPKDFNADSMSDILWRGKGGEVAVWSMSDKEIAGSAAATLDGAAANPGSSWAAAATGDFNGDGRADILWRGKAGEASIWSMDGSSVSAFGSTTLGGATVNPGTSWAVAGTGDFNGDGRADILWRGKAGEVSIWDMDGTTILSYGATTLSGAAANPGTYWTVAGTGDFNGDNRSDILWRGKAGEVSIWIMDDTHIASSGQVTFNGAKANPGTNWTVAGTADFNGDGRTDILWRGQAGEVSIWDMNGTQIASHGSPTLSGKTANPGTYWSVASTGDYNGDGRADILWRGKGDEVSIWDMNDTQILSAAEVHIGTKTVNPGGYWTVADHDPFLVF